MPPPRVPKHTTGNKHGPTLVLDLKEPLLPEASERGDAGAGPDEDAGYLGVLGQVEPGRTAHTEDTVKPQQDAPSLTSAHNELRHQEREG